MVNERTLITEIGVCVGLTEETIEHSAPTIRNVSKNDWEQLRNAYNKNEKMRQLFNLCVKQGGDLRKRIGEVRNVAWVANLHSQYGKQIDIVANDSILISCKHDSKVIYNPGPDLLFKRNLDQKKVKTSGLWFYRMAKKQYQKFYSKAVEITKVYGFPKNVLDLNSKQGLYLRKKMPPRRWPHDYPLASYYNKMNQEVSEKSAKLWNAQNIHQKDMTKLFFELFRLMPNSSYYLVGKAGKEEFITKIESQVGWRNKYFVESFKAKPRIAGQAEVGWEFNIKDLSNSELKKIEGHVQVRWSHGKNFTKNCESKVYLDCPHQKIPGYELLT